MQLVAVDAASIADKARKSIGRFCYEECNAYCCRKGALPIKVKELKLLGKEKHTSLIFYKNKLSIVLPCPSLKENKCTIHENEGRPEVCKEFPIFIKGNKVKIVGMCLAVRNGLLYPYIKQFRSLGYEVIEK